MKGLVFGDIFISDRSILLIIGTFLLKLFTILDPGDTLCEVQCFCLTKLKKKKWRRKIKIWLIQQ